MSDTSSSSNSLEQKEADSSQSLFLERPLVKFAIQNLSEMLSKESSEPEPEPEPRLKTPLLIFYRKITTVILPALLTSGIGVLAVVYPHILDDFDLPYLGHSSIIAFIALLVIAVKLLWNQIGGSLIIALSLFAIAKSILPAKQSSR